MDPSLLRSLKRKIVLFFPLGLIVMGALLFVPAGSLDFWEAWVFLGVLFTQVFFVATYFLRRDPEFLLRRMRYKEKEAAEKKMIKVGQLLFLIGFLVPGLDHRFGWSDVPSWLVLAADAIVFLGYGLVFLAFRENSYASRIVEVEKGQKVISSGPYSVIRHPMYTGVIPMYLAIPIALGSYVALLFYAPVIIIIVLRIFDEERLLSRDLPGYSEYMKKVKYRLIPGVW